MRLRELRKVKGVYQKDLAIILNLSEAAISQYEKGLRAEALWTLALDKPAPADLLIKSKPYIV